MLSHFTSHTRYHYTTRLSPLVLHWLVKSSGQCHLGSPLSHHLTIQFQIWRLHVNFQHYSILVPLCYRPELCASASPPVSIALPLRLQIQPATRLQFAAMPLLSTLILLVFWFLHVIYCMVTTGEVPTSLGHKLHESNVKCSCEVSVTRIKSLN